MSDSASGGFGKFVPGFDFLQNLSKGASAGMPGISSWVAPTLEPKEIDKRIEELKAVLFWLDQNATALKATIQALELQKMTLATLKGMNLDMGAMAQAFKFPGPVQAAAPVPKPEPEPAPAQRQAKPKASPSRKPAASKPSAAKPATGVVDPMQLWGALTQQFQEIAAGAMKEVGSQAAKVSGMVAKPAAANAAKPATVRKRAPARRR